jgi:3-oxoacyl-[acyl-carrier-protein] synthase II
LNMKIFIRSTSCISPQKTFENNGFLDDIIEYNSIRLKAIEPDYKEFIDPKLIRRMSHVIKMGVAAAKDCLNKAEVDMPGAIITGTALGCLEDTVTFLTRTIEMQEEMLPPTAFIQSTHNTVAAQIALMLKCHEYNNTFVHKGISFESALLDAIMLLKEEEADTVLVGGTEELTDTSFTVLERLGLYKRWPVSNLTLLPASSKGSVGGEGAAFFMLSNQSSENNIAELVDIKTLYKPADTDQLEKGIIDFLYVNKLTAEDIDLVITGKNGDLKNDEVYDQVTAAIFSDNSTAYYKHLSGEFPTSPAFGLWLATTILETGIIPDVVIEKITAEKKPKRILIYNHYMNLYHSLILMEAAN